MAAAWSFVINIFECQIATVIQKEFYSAQKQFQYVNGKVHTSFS